VLDLTFGTLLELEDGLKSMQGKPRRMAMRDFTIWPTEPGEHGLGAKMDDIYKRTQEKQQKDKWNQPN
jgi:hydroxyacylglutathione hydrolase